MEIDFSRVPKGELAARALVDALVQTDDRAERHFLELKSAIDLNSKAGIAKVAKFILGAANRMPDVATGYFEGHAVLALGVAPGAATGIEPVEALVIERGVRPYLSVNGPRWDLQRVPVDHGREVLLVIVDPPRAGQPAFPCFKDGPIAGLNDGQIIIRADGETRQASGEEVLLLQQRGRHHQPDVDLAVTVIGAANAPACENAVLETYLAQEGTRLRAARTRSDTRIPFGRSIMLPGSKPENRTVSTYEDEIITWQDNCRAAWPSVLEAWTVTFAPAVTLKVTNRGEAFLEAVEVELHLDGPVRAHERVQPGRVKPERITRESLLPAPPRTWGPIPITFGADRLLTGWDPPNVFSRKQLAVSIRDTEPAIIDVVVGELRPRQSYVTGSDHVVLLVEDIGVVVEVTATWKITVRGHHKVYEGTLTVPVERRDLTQVMQDILDGTTPEPGADE